MFRRYNGCMSATQWAAWVGACSGLGSLLWNVYTKLTSGSKLGVTAKPGMEALPGPRIQDQSKYIVVWVRNNGTAKTTLTAVWFATYGSWLARRRSKRSKSGLVLQPESGQPIPCTLDVGAEYVGAIRQNNDIEEMLRTGNLWCEICHSWSSRPVRARVKK
jgi:hypothetical protein